MIVEFLSESTEAVDRNQKKRLYEKYGVKEYGIVDPDEKQVTPYFLQEGAFVANTHLNESEKLTSQMMAGFTLQLAAVFNS